MRLDSAKLEEEEENEERVRGKFILYDECLCVFEIFVITRLSKLNFF